MTLKTNNNDFLTNVLRALESMGNITPTSINDNSIALYKDEVPFALVTNSTIYLRSEEEEEHQVFQGKKYGKSSVSPTEGDNFLKTVTKAYWLASGKR